MASIIRLDTADFPAFDGQESGRELELELTAVVTGVDLIAREGGSPSEAVTLVVVRADIAQTT